MVLICCRAKFLHPNSRLINYFNNKLSSKTGPKLEEIGKLAMLIDANLRGKQMLLAVHIRSKLGLGKEELFGRQLKQFGGELSDHHYRVTVVSGFAGVHGSSEKL